MLSKRKLPLSEQLIKLSFGWKWVISVVITLPNLTVPSMYHHITTLVLGDWFCDTYSLV